MTDDFHTPARREFIRSIDGAWDFLTDPLYWIACGLFVLIVLWRV